MQKSTILFDLDGTLVNTGKGVTESVRYALAKLGIEETDQRKLERFIGPPLMESFPREYGFSAEQSSNAVTSFRERYETTGVYECELYPDVEQTLRRLKKLGCTLAVASSKREDLCHVVLNYLHVEQYFDLIGGARDAGAGTKIQVLEDVIARLRLKDPGQAVLIGDTRYDAQGAKEAGIDCIGITYGFEQDFAEMKKAGTLGLFDTLPEVVDFLVQAAL
ncbi:MAG: HAD hydrolase-like protein [Lachnospiraceae bacterium]|jgi:phosphoglycolate phosphatase|nr:HAD hydrolase-like protein [Lachnospiraceae bacterium]